MKSIFILLFVLCQYNGFSQTTLEWIKKSEFDYINLPGQKLIFKQLCTTETDSILSDGSATFLHAKIKDLGECSYTRVFKDTIVSKVELYTTNKRNRDAFIAYFKKLVNEDYKVIEDKKNIRYIGFFTRDHLTVKAEFYGPKNGKKSTITLTSPEKQN